MEPLPLSSEQNVDGSWVVYVGHVPVRAGLSEDQAKWWLTRLPQEVVAGTRHEQDYRNRRLAGQRIGGILHRRKQTIETPMGLVRQSADGWGYGLYDDEYRYWFRTPVRRASSAGGRLASSKDDPEWIQADGLPVVTDQTLVWVGLNPSTSDDSPRANRVTLVKVLRWAQHLRLREVVGVNLFAYRHTDPAMLGSQLSSSELMAVIGESNDRVLAHVLSGLGTVLAAWGANGSRVSRGDAVREMISTALCLGVCANGEPKHPARIAQSTPLIPLPVR
jgi:hypothetical protein